MGPLSCEGGTDDEELSQAPWKSHKNYKQGQQGET